MYPRLGDFIYGLFGINLKIPVQTFGFFVAIAFVVAYFICRKELRRKEKLGHFSLQKIEIINEGPIPLAELILPCLLWGIVGYKVGYALVDYQDFYQNTQQVILSGKGSWLVGLGSILLYGIPRFLAYRKSQSLPLKKSEILVGPSFYMNLVLTMAFFAGILGAKIATYAEDWEKFLENPWGAIFSFDGLAWYGGLLLAAFFICWFFYKRGFEVLNCIDGFAPGLIVGYAFGRMGCQFAGDGDWGSPNLSPRPGILSWLPDWAWAYDYPHNVVKEDTLMNNCSGEFCYHLDKPVWPTPLYEIFMAFIIFGVLMLIRNKLKYPGQLTAVYMVLIGVERILVESIRINAQYQLLGLPIKFTQAEAISFFMITGGIVLYAWLTWRRKKNYPGVFPETSS